jgi:hypothetical protein
MVSNFSRGTESYRAPELIREHPVFTKKVDIWAVGCIFYEIVTSRKAFHGDWRVREYGLEQAQLENVFIDFHYAGSTQFFERMISWTLHRVWFNRPAAEKLIDWLQGFDNHLIVGSPLLEPPLLPKLAYQTRILETGTTFSEENNGVWLMTDYTGDGKLDLVYIKTSNTDRGTVEVHVASGASNYRSHILATGTTFTTEDNGTWTMARYTGGPRPDLIYIKTRNTETMMVEVHIASANSNYQHRVLEVGTAFATEENGVWLMNDFLGSGKPDLVFIKTSQTGTGKVEVHVASEASGYQRCVLKFETTFACEDDGTWTMAHYIQSVPPPFPDLVYIKTINTAMYKVEVHIASGESGYKTRVQEVPTTFDLENNGVWQMASRTQSGLGLPDLVYIKTQNTDTRSVEVHIAAGE